MPEADQDDQADQADQDRPQRQPRRRLGVPVRLRVTALASMVVAVSLFAGAWLFLRAMHTSRVAEIDRDARVRADAVIETVRAGQARTPLPSARDSSLMVQVIDRSGGVAASTANVMDMNDPFVNPLRFPVTPARAMMWSAVIDHARVRLCGKAVAVGDTGYVVYVATPLTDLEESIDAFRRQLLRTSPFVLAGTVLALYLVVGRALRPVDVLRLEVEAIEPGDLQRRVTVPRVDDEVGRLAHTMNALLDRLQSANERQARFLSDASHELRTPLAVTRTRLEVGLRHTGTTDWPHTARAVLEQSRRMERLVSELLTLVRADGGVAGLSVDVDLEDLVRSAVTDARASSPRAVVDLSHLLAGRVHGDPDQLRRVVANLLDNALRHARAMVIVSLRVDGARVTLTVDDDGPGIDAADRQRVFQRFTRLDDSRARTSGGAGLGLAIVSELVMAHGGTVRVDTSPAGGARFVVELPEAH